MLAADEPRCLCLIRDMLIFDEPSSQWSTMNVPASTLCSTLLRDVAQHFRRTSNSISLIYERNEATQVCDIFLFKIELLTEIHCNNFSQLS